MKSFPVSTPARNGQGIRIPNESVRTDVFRANPVMLWQHKRGEVIGNWDKDSLRIENGVWLADPVFDTETKLGKRVAGQVERGFVRGCSIGGRIEAAHLETDADGEVLVVDSFLLLEISMVDIPANAGTVAFYDRASNLLSPDEVRLAYQPTDKTDRTNPTDSGIGGSNPAAPTPGTDQPTPLPMDLIPLCLALSLAEDATAEQITQAVVSLKAASLTTQSDDYKARYETLLAATQAEQTAQATALCAQAVREGRMTAPQQAVYMKLFAADFGSTASVVASLPAPVNLAAAARQNQPPGETDAQRYDAMDKANTLAKFKSENEAEFRRLHKARYGVDYRD